MRLGAGHPAAAWPAGEATVGAELMELDKFDSYAVVAVRGLRWTAFTKGDSWPGPDHTGRVRVGLVLGDDPQKPPGGERSLRFRRDVNHLVSDPNNPNQRWWGRAGVLPDRVDVDIQPINTGLPQLGKAIQVGVAGALRRVVAQMLDDAATCDPAHIHGTRVWLSLDGTGTATHNSDDGSTTSVRVYHDDEKTIVTSAIPLHLGGAAHGADLGNRSTEVHAQLRVPTDVRLDMSSEDESTLPPGQDQASDTAIGRFA